MEKELEGNVRLEITGGRGEIKNCYDGQCHYRNGHHYVLFQEEIEEDGGKGKVTFSSRLKLSDDQVTLRRSHLGEKTAHVMEFVYRKQEAGERGCFVDYPTPYGIMRLEIRTQELRVEREKGELSCVARYVMLQEGHEISRDEVRITVRRAPSA